MIKRLILNNESIHCSQCMLSHLCIPQGLDTKETAKLDNLIKERLRVPKGRFLYQAKDSVKAVYSVRSGSFKTQLESKNGHLQITGFFLPGEIIGLDGLADESHLSHAIALEDSEVCVMHLEDLDKIAKEIPKLQFQFRRILSQEISRSHNVVLSLGSLRSEQRLAAFLINMANRFKRLGYSSNEFILRMPRGDIGNYLGLTLETVSRLLSRLNKEKIIQVNQREIVILDRETLQNMLQIDPPV